MLPPVSRVAVVCLVAAFAGLLAVGPVRALEPIPDRLVVLTFDDSVSSHHRVVRPLLKELGFGATFFITEGFSFRTNKTDYMTWEQIAELHRDGFEIGNHTRDHLGITADTVGLLRQQVEAINERCAEHGIPKPVSFSWPGNAIHPGAFPILRDLGIRFARRGGQPEHSYEWGRGFAFEPGADHPLFIPSAGDARPDWVLDDFRRAVDQARDGRIAVMQFHGVPDRDHPWVNYPEARFREAMAYLNSGRFRVVALRDLARYVDATVWPAEVMAVVNRRRAARTEQEVRIEIVAADSRQALEARVTLRGEDGVWHFPKSTALNGGATRYERRSGFHTNAVEMHTAVSAHPSRLELPPGRYRLRVDRGKEWMSHEREFEVAREPLTLRVELSRLVDMAARGWFSGDTHVHRSPQELRIPALAEDVNVVLPMTDWTTVSTVSPTASAQSLAPAPTANLIEFDASHVLYPRNTEYEIFRTGAKTHTLGAFLVVHHRERFDQNVFPLDGVLRRARSEGALIDLEKHNWPWSIALAPVLNPDLYELANNHHWQTEFGVRNWAEPAPAWMGIAGTGTDTEWGWTLYGFRAWYALLNCGFNPRPTAGTAHGVHPVPMGFGRVYVHLEGPFDFGAWMKGLSAGRSFVTTGPLLMVKADGALPGARFTARQGEETTAHELAGEVFSMTPLTTVEVVWNGEVVRALGPADWSTSRVGEGWRTEWRTQVKATGSGWFAVRGWETHAGDRRRFAHTAAWWVDVPGRPLKPSRAEADWGVARAEAELQRNRGVVPEEGLVAYETALARWREIAASARP